MNGSKSNVVLQKAELIELYDDFVEFNDYCSFLCDAIPSLFSEVTDGEPGTHTVMGLRRQCSDLKERAETLGCALNGLLQ
ncbi:MAG: hypothetical protein ACI93R_002968 [Flavobacteriales bacterium]|jgi:hypothetical protein